MPRTRKLEFDGVIVGGGHNGLVAAAYLCGCGMRIGIFEAGDTVGGALCTVKSTSGALHNLHAVHLKFHLGPIYEDLRLQEFGASLITPEVKIASLYRDGTALVVHTDIQRTCNSIARLSKTDAIVFAREALRWKDWNRRFVIPEIYNAPEEPGARRDRLRAARDGGDYLAVANMTPRAYTNALFEDSRVAAVMLWALRAQGYMADYPGISPAAMFTAFSALVEPMAICAGGSGRLAGALRKFIVQQGGEVFEGRPVQQIVVTQNKATGVVLNDLEEVHSRHFVVSGVNPQHTFQTLVGTDHLPSDLVASVRTIKADEWTLLGVHLSLKEPPRHVAAEHSPDVDLALKYLIQGDPDEAAEAESLLRKGLLRRTPQFGAGCLSNHDSNLAPPGQHSAYIWEVVPYRLSESVGEWEQVQVARAAQCVAHWAQYAPNLTEANIISRFVYGPIDMAAQQPNLIDGGLNAGAAITPAQSGHLRPTPQLSHYRTPVQSLYLCGAAMHPGGGATGAPGYNAANLIADDLGLRKWWHPISIHEQ